MKKYFITLLLLLVFPVICKAGTITTSFDSEKCILTVSGTNTGHDATVSLFDKDDKFIGLKTSEISSGNYSVDFVLTYDQDELINITLSNENGGNETKKNDVNIPACHLEKVVKNKLDDGNGNSIEFNDANKSFADHDHLVIEMMDEEALNQFLESIKGTAEYDGTKGMVDGILESLKPYKAFAGVVNVYVRDENNTDKYFESYNEGFKVRIQMDKETYKNLNGLKFSPINSETGKLDDSIEISYDDANELLVLNIKRPGNFIGYIDKDYAFLDNTDNQTYTKGKDESLTVRVDAEYSKYVDVMIDGNIVKNVKTKDGSTIVEFIKGYLDGLTEGTHEIRVNFKDGKAVTTLTVDSITPASSNSSTNPKTSDNIMIYYYILGTSIIAISSMVFIKKKLHN